MFVNPHIQSSYRKHALGKTLYDMVVQHKPKAVVEFGTYHGYSAACIAQGLRDNGFGKLTSYDLWDRYEFKHGDLEKTRENLRVLGLDGYVDLVDGDLSDWLKNPTDFDMAHIDVSNTGDTIESLKQINRPDRVIMFEGGSKERDEIGWMRKFSKRPIVGSAQYLILDDRFPSISMLI